MTGKLSRVPALFARDLCGYRLDRDGNLTTKPNTSDANDDLSVVLGTTLFDQLGVQRDEVAPPDPGTDMERRVVEYLRVLRPDLRIERSRPARDFIQYAHLGVFRDFKANFGDQRPILDKLANRIGSLDLGSQRSSINRELRKLSSKADLQAKLVTDLAEQMPEESLLKIDISVAIPRGDDLDELAIAISAKWSLRTDRAQDCVAQGNKLVNQRRGKMPHFGVLTMETRPAMLKILADGSGAVDYVYHLDLAALGQTIEGLTEAKGRTWSPGSTFRRLSRQHRMRDFDQLVDEVMRVPTV
ncbi:MULTISPECIES: NgoMIV family type II restriction endonuclease [Gordonia]|uniref:NgoMIV family type II restriction endonuclease n=1 Tax=Gordonia TaxID=2053 RepID=UPI00339A1179